MIMLEIVVEVIGCFCSNRTDLLIASCVARDKKYRNPEELSYTSLAIQRLYQNLGNGDTNLVCRLDPLLAVEI